MADVKRINLALQGGGAHGAFTWGVLDHLLQDDSIDIAAISGSSAGALNGAALKAGLISGGREGARENLDWLWGQMGAIGDLRMADWMSSVSPGPGAISQMLEQSLPFSISDAATRVFSPYNYGPFYRNPLGKIVRRFKYDAVCADDGPALFVAATNVRTGKIHIFSGAEISSDALMASSCLPSVFQAVEIMDPATGVKEAYWDGGYTGNPALFPLFEPEFPDDIVIVNINPMYRDEIPKEPREILNRINEISFNSSLLRELRAIEFVQRLISDGKIPKGAMKNVLVHMISDDDLMTELSVASKMMPSPTVLSALKSAGEAAAKDFLDQHRAKIGRQSSVDLPAMYA